MKIKILLAASAVAVLACACQPDPARAGTYTLTTDATQEAGITSARLKYNASLPQTIEDGMGNQVQNPALLATNDAYVAKVTSDAIASWVAAAGVHADLSLQEKAAAATILQAAVDKGDANSAAAAALLARLQQSQ